MKNLGNAAIIGSGMAGLSAARVLADAGLAVTVFDKGRKPGGRLATRRAEGFTFNHGCQFFTARDAGFAAAVQEVSAPWPAAGAGEGRFAGVPDMAAIAAGLAAGLDMRQSAHVRGWARDDSGWRLHFDDGDAGPFDAVILAVPAPQAAVMLDAVSHPFARRLDGVAMAPCWAVMLGFAAPPARTALEIELNVPAWPDGIWTSFRQTADGPVSWAARENSRPGAAASPPAFTFHFSAAWSAAHLEETPEDVIAVVRQGDWAFGDRRPVYAAAHRWRYALAEKSLGEAFLWDEQAGLGVCGDWCLAGRLEAAYLSGRGLGIRAAS